MQDRDNFQAENASFVGMGVHRPNRTRGRPPKRRLGPSAAIFILAGTLATGGCGGIPGVPLPNESTEAVDKTRFALLARFVHISDAQIVDEESPARLTVLRALSSTAWRPHEAYSTQLLDGMIRTVNKMHVAREPVDFLIQTGDAADNAQWNELDWFMTVMDGGRIDPRTAPDDRPPSQRPDQLLDPHAVFEAQGLYRHGVHGDLATIPWYSLVGNHDHFALGVFPIVTDLLGHRYSPLMFENRIGLFLPINLDPVGTVAYAPVTPANPEPSVGISLPTIVEANPDRAYFTSREFIAAHQESPSDPPGHGFGSDPTDETWYSVSPMPGLRLIGINSASPILERPTLVYSEGAVSTAQRQFLVRELRKAQDSDEIVIVASHHPSESLDPLLGTALVADSLIRLLNEYPCVRLHIAGHWHTHAVIDRGGYLEIVTGAIIDPPQEGRVIEIWRDGDETELRYWTFSHLEQIDPPPGSDPDLFDDPLMPMRRMAAEIANRPR